MTLVSLSMSDENWKKLCEGTLEGLNSRKLLESVQNDAMAKTLVVEAELGLKIKNIKKPNNPQPLN
jgi:hypothetical protein